MATPGGVAGKALGAAGGGSVAMARDANRNARADAIQPATNGDGVMQAFSNCGATMRHRGRLGSPEATIKSALFYYPFAWRKPVRRRSAACGDERRTLL